MVNRTEANSRSHPKIGTLGFGTCQKAGPHFPLHTHLWLSALPLQGEDLRRVFNLLFGGGEVSEVHPDYSLIPQAKLFRRHRESDLESHQGRSRVKLVKLQVSLVIWSWVGRQRAALLVLSSYLSPLLGCFLHTEESLLPIKPHMYNAYNTYTCMCLCVYIIHIYIHTYMYIYINAYLQAHTCTHKHIHTYTHL